MADIAPGWYKDPAEPTTQRYWDGEGWFGDPLPVDATPPEGPPPAAPGPAPTTTPETSAGPASGSPPQVETPGGTLPGGGPPDNPAAGGYPGPPLYPYPQGMPLPQDSPAPPHGPVPPGAPLPPYPAGAPLPPYPPGAPLPPYPAGRPRQLPPGVRFPPGMRAGIGYPVTRVGARPGFVLVQPTAHGLPVAPLGLRLLARLIDIAAVLALNIVGNGWLVYLYLRDISPTANAMAQQWIAAKPDYGQVPQLPNSARWLVELIPLVAMALWLAYEVPAIGQSGQTFGKRLVGIKVMAWESDQPIGFSRAARRWNLLGVPILAWTCFGLGFLFQLADSLSPTLGGPFQLALHDRLARTVVVRTGRRGHEIAPMKAVDGNEKVGD